LFGPGTGSVPTAVRREEDAATRGTHAQDWQATEELDAINYPKDWSSRMTFPMNVIVASSVRSAVGRAIKGTLKDTRPEDMAATVMVAAVERVPGLSPDMVDDVILGCAMPEAEQGWNVARNAVFVARFPNSVPAET